MSYVAGNKSRSQAFRERTPLTGRGLLAIKPLLALIVLHVGVLIFAGPVGCQWPKSSGQTVDRQSAPGTPDIDFLSGTSAGGATAWQYLNDSEDRWAGQLGSLPEVAYTPGERDGRGTEAASLDGASTMGAGLGHPVNGGEKTPRDAVTPTDSFPPSGHLTSVLRSEDMPASTITVGKVNRPPELVPICTARE